MLNIFLNYGFISGALGGIFSQISSEDDIVREKAIKFLNYSVQLLLKEIFLPNPDIELFLFQEIKKAGCFLFNRSSNNLQCKGLDLCNM